MNTIRRTVWKDWIWRLSELTCTNSKFSLLDQRLTFLGCVMEFLRSSLAQWVHLNPNAAQSVWSPSLRQV